MLVVACLVAEPPSESLDVVRIAHGRLVIARESESTVGPSQPPIPSPPAPADLVWAEGVARTYWHAVPACGQPAIVFGPTPTGDSGVANYASCSIVISTAYGYAEVGGRTLLCETLVHEYGHLVLGPNYFAAVNPADPAHSPDPHSIMAATEPTHFPPCEAGA